MEDNVEEVRTGRMKNMEPEGDRGYFVEAKTDGRWVRLIEDGTRGQAERVAAEARARLRRP